MSDWFADKWLTGSDEWLTGLLMTDSVWWVIDWFADKWLTGSDEWLVYWEVTDWLWWIINWFADDWLRLMSGSPMGDWFGVWLVTGRYVVAGWLTDWLALTDLLAGQAHEQDIPIAVIRIWLFRIFLGIIEP